MENGVVGRINDNRLLSGDLGLQATWDKTYYDATTRLSLATADSIIESLEAAEGTKPLVVIICGVREGSRKRGEGPFVICQVEKIHEYRTKAFLQSEEEREEREAEERKQKARDDAAERRTRLIRTEASKIRGERLSERAASQEIAESNLSLSYESEAEQRLVEQGLIEPEVEALETVG